MTTDEGETGAVVVRSEQELFITTHRRERETARLTRYVESETVTRIVEVHHERVRIEYAPVAPQTAASPASAADGDGWMILYDEEVVVTTRRVPRERVRLRTHAVTERREISEPLQKERVELKRGTCPE